MNLWCYCFSQKFLVDILGEKCDLVNSFWIYLTFSEKKSELQFTVSNTFWVKRRKTLKRSFWGHWCQRQLMGVGHLNLKYILWNENSYSCTDIIAFIVKSTFSNSTNKSQYFWLYTIPLWDLWEVFASKNKYFCSVHYSLFLLKL